MDAETKSFIDDIFSTPKILSVQGLFDLNDIINEAVMAKYSKSDNKVPLNFLQEVYGYVLEKFNEMETT